MKTAKNVVAILLEHEFAENIRLFDCTISGQPGQDSFTVYEFSSSFPGHGNAKKALIELKHRYGRLFALDPGEDGTESNGFWRHMLSIGAIDGLLDENGDEFAGQA